MIPNKAPDIIYHIIESMVSYMIPYR